jgi:hypothetical protein
MSQNVPFPFFSSFSSVQALCSSFAVSAFSFVVAAKEDFLPFSALFLYFRAFSLFSGFVDNNNKIKAQDEKRRGENGKRGQLQVAVESA